jgi:hypothetical protein
MTAPQPIRLGRHFPDRNRPPPGEPRNALSSWSGDMSSSPQLCSAEGAVDDDFSQGGLEYGEFVVVEPLDE